MIVRAADVPRPATIVPEPWLLSICMVAVIALLLGGVRVMRAGGQRRQGVLMLVAAAVLFGNVLIWAWV